MVFWLYVRLENLDSLDERLKSINSVVPVVYANVLDKEIAYYFRTKRFRTSVSDKLLIISYIIQWRRNNINIRDCAGPSAPLGC